MIKNTSGLAVQPCRLHERFYYHARLLYYILRQKARGFFDAGVQPPRYPDMRGGAAPSLPRYARGLAPPLHSPMWEHSSHALRERALRESMALPCSAPRVTLCGTAAPAPTFWALRPKPRPTFSRRESRQRYARNLLVPGPPAKGASPPLIPRPCALAVLVAAA